MSNRGACCLRGLKASSDLECMARGWGSKAGLSSIPRPEPRPWSSPACGAQLQPPCLHHAPHHHTQPLSPKRRNPTPHTPDPAAARTRLRKQREAAAARAAAIAAEARSPHAKASYSAEEFEALAAAYEALKWRMIQKPGGASVRPGEWVYYLSWVGGVGNLRALLRPAVCC